MSYTKSSINGIAKVEKSPIFEGHLNTSLWCPILYWHLNTGPKNVWLFWQMINGVKFGRFTSALVIWLKMVSFKRFWLFDMGCSDHHCICYIHSFLVGKFSGVSNLLLTFYFLTITVLNNWPSFHKKINQSNDLWGVAAYWKSHLLTASRDPGSKPGGGCEFICVFM